MPWPPAAAPACCTARDATEIANRGLKDVARISRPADAPERQRQLAPEELRQLRTVASAGALPPHGLHCVTEGSASFTAASRSQICYWFLGILIRESDMRGSVFHVPYKAAGQVLIPLCALRYTPASVSPGCICSGKRRHGLPVPTTKCLMHPSPRC